MTATSLIIVADRGSLRAYRVQETPTRGPHLDLVQAFEVTDVMDAASTQHETPMTDWPALEAEMDRRVCKELATEIAKIVRARCRRRLVVRRARIDSQEDRRAIAT